MSVLENFLLEPMKFLSQNGAGVMYYLSTSDLESMIPKVIRYHIGAYPYGYDTHLVEDTMHVVYHSKALLELSILQKNRLKIDQ